MPTLPLMVYVAMGCSALFLLFYGWAFEAREFYPVASVPNVGTSPRVPAITVAVGLFGGVLFVAFTVLKYRGHLQADARLSIEQREAVLRTSEHFSERFSQAAEMLGAPRAATRMGGAYALAALADEWKENRQQCIDLLCGYLRTPIPRAPETSSGDATSDPKDIQAPPITPKSMLVKPQDGFLLTPDGMERYVGQRRYLASTYTQKAAADEMVVRKAIVSAIARGTRRPLDDPTSWGSMRFDLGRCYLEDVDFSGCHFAKDVNFNYSMFGGYVNMRDAHFANNAQFDGCIFTGPVWFSGAEFTGSAWFRATEFQKEASFGRVQFKKLMLFALAHFEELPHFRANSLGDSSAPGADQKLYANLDGVFYGGDLSACPSAGCPTIWDQFSYVGPGYKIICERSHPPLEHDLCTEVVWDR